MSGSPDRAASLAALCIVAMASGCAQGGSAYAPASALVSAHREGRANASLVPIPGPTSSPSATCDRVCYYVDAKSGSDSNPGTAQAPFKTLNKAASLAKPGVTVIVASGTYVSAPGQSSAPLYLHASGTPDAWIKFVAAPGAHPVIRLLRCSECWDGIQLEGTAYVLIDGFEVVGQNQSITWAEAKKNTGSQAWLNETCIDIDGYGWKGFKPGIPHDVVIRNNIARDCSGSGIAEDGGDSVTIAYNTIYDNSWWTVYGTSGLNIFHQLDVKGASVTHGYNTFLVGNVVYGNHLNLPWIGANPPAITDGNGIIIDSNLHQDGGGPPYRGRTYIANNVSYGNGGRGVHVYASQHVDIVNNTAYDNMLSHSKDITCGEVDAVSAIDVNVLNNIGINLDGKQVVCNYGDKQTSFGYDLWSGKDVTVKGPHDIVGNPRLTDPRAGNFAPAPGSPAIASGTAALAPSLDLFAAPRDPAAIDRGAIAVSH